MSSCDSLTTQASSFLASERPKMIGVERSGRSSNHFTKRVCFFVPKRGNQCTKEERLSHSRCFISSDRPKMTGGERSRRSSEVKGTQTVLVSFERKCGRLSEVF